MIYQVITYNYLCVSKVALSNRKDILKHLDRVVKATESYRESLDKEIIRLLGWDKKVSKKEMENSMCINKIEEKDVLKWKKIFKTSNEISAKNLKSIVDVVMEKDNRSKNNDEND